MTLVQRPDRQPAARAFGVVGLEPPALLDGNYDMRVLGYSRRPEVKITQKRPMPLTILAIGYELEAS